MDALVAERADPTGIWMTRIGPRCKWWNRNVDLRDLEQTQIVGEDGWFLLHGNMLSIVDV